MLKLSGRELSMARTVQAPSCISPRGWVCAGLGLAVLLTALALAAKGLNHAGLQLALRLTGRLAFLTFWPCYTAGALVALFGPRLAPLKRRARALGLTFAALLAYHLGLILALSLATTPPPARVFLLFGPGVACTLLLAAASIGPVSRAIGPRGWWVLRNMAMNYILLDFVIDFTRSVPLNSTRGLLLYLPFAVLAVAAPALRLAALFRARHVLSLPGQA